MWLCQQVFGTTITFQRNYGEIQVPVREIAELGPPWGKDHRTALAATIVAGTGA